MICRCPSVDSAYCEPDTGATHLVSEPSYPPSSHFSARFLDSLFDISYITDCSKHYYSIKKNDH